ncbi:MAG: uL30 family ribosomal protein, partial [Nanoarchaeota archaeon]|nr:uL30 family ribosomal protein [Nanoarchaeota archaeon]
MDKIAIIRVRGAVNLNYEVKETMNLLRLYRKNFCVVVDNTPSIQGMIKKVKDYVTYGELDHSIYKELVEKRGEEFKGRE